jgi:hypothetical protein
VHVALVVPCGDARGAPLLDQALLEALDALPRLERAQLPRAPRADLRELGALRADDALALVHLPLQQHLVPPGGEGREGICKATAVGVAGGRAGAAGRVRLVRGEGRALSG